MIIRKRVFSCLTVFSVVLSLATFCNAFDKVGTTAAQFLQIGVGGRIPALGGAGVAMVNGAEALYWNPAGILRNRNFSLSAYYADWFIDLQHQFLGVTVPVGKNAALGFQAITLGGDEFEQTTLSSQEGNGVMVEYGDLALGVSYAQRLTDRFCFGGTVKYIHQKMFHETASTIALDVGTNLQTDLPGFYIGMAMTNLGGEMKLEGRDLLTGGEEEVSTEYHVSGWPLPLTFQVGIGWRLFGSTDALWDGGGHGLTLVADGHHINEGLTRWRTGMEYDFNRMVFARMGRVFEHHTEEWTFGGGVKASVGKYTLVVDMAYADMGDLGGVERLSVGIMGK